MSGLKVAAVVGIALGLANAGLNLFIMREEGAGIGARELATFGATLVALPLVAVGLYLAGRGLRRLFA